MNIISENQKSTDNYIDCKKGPHRRCYCACDQCCSCACEPGKALLRCACASAGPLPILGSAGLIPTMPIPVGSVSIDTSKLTNPSTLLSVTLQINTPAALVSNLTFRIVKCVCGCTQPVGGSYTFSNAIEALSSDSFCFKFCDSTECCGCATYSVEVSSATLVQAGTTICGTISALAVENLC